MGEFIGFHDFSFLDMVTTCLDHSKICASLLGWGVLFLDIVVGLWGLLSLAANIGRFEFKNVASDHEPENQPWSVFP